MLTIHAPQVPQPSVEDWLRLSRVDYRWTTVTMSARLLRAKLGDTAWRAWVELTRKRELGDSPCDGGRGTVFIGAKGLAKAIGSSVATAERAFSCLTLARLVEVVGWTTRGAKAVYVRRVFGVPEYPGPALDRAMVPITTQRWARDAADANAHGGRRQRAGRKCAPVGRGIYNVRAHEGGGVPSFESNTTPPIGSESSCTTPNQAMGPPLVATKSSEGRSDLLKISLSYEILESKLSSALRAGGSFSSRGERGEYITNAATGSPTPPKGGGYIVGGSSARSTGPANPGGSDETGPPPKPIACLPDAGLVVKIPQPPKLPPTAGDDELARLLVNWAAGAVERETAQRAWHLRKLRSTSKTWALAVECAKALRDGDVAPVDYLWWQLATWKEHVNKGKKSKAPPLTWLFNVKRATDAADLNFRSHAAWSDKYTPAGVQYIKDRAVLHVRGATPEGLRALALLVPIISAEVAKEQRRINETVKAGGWVW